MVLWISIRFCVRKSVLKWLLMGKSAMCLSRKSHKGRYQTMSVIKTGFYGSQKTVGFQETEHTGTWRNKKINFLAAKTRHVLYLGYFRSALRVCSALVCTIKFIPLRSGLLKNNFNEKRIERGIWFIPASFV